MTYNPNSVWESKEKKYEYAPNAAETAKQAKPEAPKPPAHAPAPEPNTGPSFFKRHGILFFSLILVAVFALAGFVVYLLLPPSTPNVAISFSKPDNVQVGQPFTLTLALTNYSNAILKNTDLSILLPPGISFIGQSSGQRVIEESLGDMGSQDIKRQDFNLVVTANPQSIQRIDAKFTYATANNGKTQFETDGGADLIVGDSAMNVTFTTPSNIFSGQNFDVTVNYANESGEELHDVVFNANYPPAFSFVKSSIQPATPAHNAWVIGDLQPNATGSFTITGNIVGPEAAIYALAGTITADFQSQTYPVNEQTTNFVIASAPLSLSVDLNGKSDYVAGLNDTLTYTLHYKNNSTVTFRAVSIKATLVGSMFDLTTLKADGPFDSRTNSVSWNAASAPGLLSIAPGQSGSVSFTVQTKSAFPIRLVSDKNFILKVNAQIQSPTVPPNTAGSNTVSVTAIQNKIGGQAIFAAKGLHKEKTGGILNSGPYPPKVNQETDYTIHWTAASYSTDLQNVTFSAYLQSGTTFTGQVKSNVSTTPQYDSTTGLVTWTIPVVPATTGIISPPIEATFQVANTPAINQVNSNVTLMGETDVKGTDAFTSSPVSAELKPITSDLPDDPSFGGPDRRVSQ